MCNGWDERMLRLQLAYHLTGAHYQYYRQRKAETWLPNSDNSNAGPHHVRRSALSLERTKEDLRREFAPMGSTSRVRAMLALPQRPDQSMKSYFEEKMAW